jgi:hypothetical protein
MGEIISIQIDSIFDGIMPSSNFGGKGQYLSGIGIDPDVPASDSASDLKTAGIIRPVNYVAFSGSAVTAAPIAIINTPKNTLTYAILSNGRIVSYDSSLANETLVGTVSGGVARGAFYYNNYIYVITATDISRYGPLDNSPTLTDGVWTGSTLGSLTALVDTTYPTTLLSVGYLNHFGFTHVDNRAYFLDYVGGQGKIHYVKTKKTTDEGDTNDNSSYGFLSLPFNFIPLVGCSYGNDIVISGTYTSSNSVDQGQAALFFFNPADTVPSFYRVVKLPDTICSVLTYDNGVMYGISGDISGGYRLWRYVGGDSVETLKIVEDGYPPLQGAVASIANRIVWGANTTYPMVSSGLYAYGSKSDLFPRGLHHIALSGFTS